MKVIIYTTETYLSSIQTIIYCFYVLNTVQGIECTLWTKRHDWQLYETYSLEQGKKKKKQTSKYLKIIISG